MSEFDDLKVVQILRRSPRPPGFPDLQSCCYALGAVVKRSIDCTVSDEARFLLWLSQQTEPQDIAYAIWGGDMSGSNIFVSSPRYTIPRVYPKLYGGPLYWKDETSGVLKAAMMGYLERHEITPLFLDYLNYWIEAPAWRFRETEPEYLAALAELIARSKTLKHAQEVRTWINDCLNWGIDPL
jgi:hypothetical protein